MKKLLAILILLSFLFNGCTKEVEVVKYKYVKQEVPTLKNLPPVKKYKLKAYPLDERFFKVPKRDLRNAKRTNDKLREHKAFLEGQNREFNKKFAYKSDAEAYAQDITSYVLGNW